MAPSSIQQQYEQFRAGKVRRAEVVGRNVDDDEISPDLWPFARDVVREAVRKGRFAIFADCGLSKTRMQLEWSRLLRPPNGRSLIVAPLSVIETGQTQDEARVLGMEVTRVTAPSDAPYQLTNYERLHNFVGCDSEYSTLALDESSILKSIDGKTRTMILEEFTGIRHRLACTATPAPNDVSELANHAEFVGAMSRPEMLATYFVHDAAHGAGWRLRGHGEDAFWRWVATWAVYIRTPSDIGHLDDGFILPELSIEEVMVRTDYQEEGKLFPLATGIQGARAARRGSLDERVSEVAARIRASERQSVVWHGLNDEGRMLAGELADDAVLIEGATSEADRMLFERRWRAGEVKTLITKPAIYGYGINWQHCSEVYYLGLGYSYEDFYQTVRRVYRFGQLRPVDAYIVVSEPEADVVATVRRKEQEAATMAARIVAHIKGAMMEELQEQGGAERGAYAEDEATGDGWRLLLGDAVERLAAVETGSVGLSVFSPAFASLYTYSDSPRDMGNCSGFDEFREHFAFFAPELLRVTMPGRRACVHVQQVALRKAVDGVIGWYDFRADVVRTMVESGWIYDGEIVVDKDPQAQAIRTKSKQLMFVQKNRDSSWLRPAMGDYILLFRAPGDNPEPVKTDVTNEEWILWARPIWYGISESDTLNAAEARSEKDERHICPLQLGTIERCVRLWSNPGDVIADPFAGLGSTGVVALKYDRQFVGVELKRAYWDVARKNLSSARMQRPLFDLSEEASCE